MHGGVWGRGVDSHCAEVRVPAGRDECDVEKADHRRQHVGGRPAEPFSDKDIAAEMALSQRTVE